MSIARVLQGIFSGSEARRLRLIADLLQRENDELRRKIYSLQGRQKELAKFLHDIASGLEGG
jgi:hypothetical protein